MQPQFPSTTVRGSRRIHSTVQVRRNRYRIIPSGLLAIHDSAMEYVVDGGLRDHEPKAEREMKQALFSQPDHLEQIKSSFYLCDQFAVELMVKAVTEAWPCPLGSWVRQELDAGHLWSCKAVDAVRGWKVCTLAPRCADYDTREAVLCLLATLRIEFHLVTMTVDDAVMFDIVQTYAWSESTIEGAPSKTCRQLITANRAFEEMCLGSDQKRAATMWELFLPTYTIRGNPGPTVLFVDDLHQDQPQEPHAFARGPPARPAPPAYLLCRQRTSLALQFFGSSRPRNDVPGE